MEESEHYTAFVEKERNEFIFHLFSRLCIGGAVCQYEDYVTEYLNTTKLLYKDLVSVSKDSESGELMVMTLALEIKSIDVSMNPATYYRECSRLRRRTSCRISSICSSTRPVVLSVYSITSGRTFGNSAGADLLDTCENASDST